MEQSTIKQTLPGKVQRLSRNSTLFKVIIEAIREKKGEKIVSLDLKKIDEAVSDFFIICEAQSGIQISAIANNIEKQVREQCQEKPYHFEEGPAWTLVDYVNIVIHIFSPEERKFYDIEGLWMDANQKEHA